MLLLAPRADGAPAGPTYNPAEISGIVQSGSETTINQSANRAVINWQSFNVKAEELVRFNQPGAGSATLNRVQAGQESVIAGRIIAPGQVIILNSNGVVFTDSAKIDVGSLVVSSIGISDRNFQAGKLVFDQPGSPDAVVRNAGTITVAESGLAAFVAPAVANSGAIVARTGTVALVAGQAATIDLHGDGLVSIAVTDPVTRMPRDVEALVEQGGVIRADGGRVLITAQAAAGVVNNAINMTGLIQARGISADGGSITLVGSGGDVRVAGTINAGADGAGNGGGIVIGGRNVTVSAGATIAADSTGSGDGGSVLAGATEGLAVNGVLSAQGGSGGRGGFVETSAKGKLDIGAGATVRVGAPGGTPGLWWIDPSTLTVVGSGGAGGGSTIDATVVAAALANGMVVLQATDLVDITAPIEPASAPGGLQLIADGPNGRVVIGAAITLPNGNLAVRAMQAITLTAGTIVDVGTGTVWLQTGEAGTIAQGTASAFRAGSLAAVAADIDLGSLDNHVETLAGMATNGGFRFGQTNANGVTTFGTVADPFAAQALSGVGAETRAAIGSQVFEATGADGTFAVTLTAGGALFNSVVFTALPYGLIETPAGPLPLDSSDYFVQQLDFAGRTARPQSLASGMTVRAGIGAAVDDANRWGVVAISSPGPSNQNELQRDAVTGVSEQLTFGLGTTTASIDATLALFYRPDAADITIERGLATFYRTTPGTPQIVTRQVTVPPGTNPPGTNPPGTNPTAPTPSGGGAGVPATVAAAVNLTEPPVRGRDPDTPADAVYRTTALENPYVEDPFDRGYSLGAVQVPADPLSADGAAGIAPAAGAGTSGTSAVPVASPGARRAGQHARRGYGASAGGSPVNLGGQPTNAITSEAALADIAPGAGPAPGGGQSSASGCTLGRFMADFWTCSPAALPLSGRSR